MKIRKFVQMNIILSILLIVVLYGLSWVYINYVNDRTVKFMEYNKLPNNSVDLVVLGSSHAKYGIKIWEKNQMNLSLDQQGIYYSYKLLEKYQEKIKDNSILIIPLSIFSFNEEMLQENLINDQVYKNYLTLLEKEDLKKNISATTYYFSKYFSILYPLNNFIKTIKYFFNSGFKKIYIEYPRNIRGEMLQKEILNAKNHVLGINNKNFFWGIKYMLKILEIQEEKNLIPVFCITPYYYSYNEALEKIDKKIYKKNIYNNLEEIKKIKNKEYIFLDYSHDKRFKDNLEYFFDDDHLNKKGAEYFTKILFDDIKERIK